MFKDLMSLYTQIEDLFMQDIVYLKKMEIKKSLALVPLREKLMGELTSAIALLNRQKGTGALSADQKTVLMERLDRLEVLGQETQKSMNRLEETQKRFLDSVCEAVASETRPIKAYAPGKQKTSSDAKSPLLISTFSTAL